MKPLAALPSTRPKKPTPRPQASDVLRLMLIERPTGPPSPRSGRGMDGVGSAVVTPMSRRAKASMPIASSARVTTATRMTGGQSYWPASAMWFEVQPHQVRLAKGASSGTAPW